MKKFDALTFDYAAYLAQLGEFRALLAANVDLSEKYDVLPFFQERRQLCAMFGMFNPYIGLADQFAKEFDIFGDFACDIAVGDSKAGAYCFIEFEDARAASVFEKKGTKATREWGRRFEHGCSQIVDWVHKLGNRGVSPDNLDRFGHHEISFETVLVIGRDIHQTPGEMQRLSWRSNRVSVDNKKIVCLTFDQLYRQFDARSSVFAVVEKDAASKTSTLPSPPTAT